MPRMSGQAVALAANSVSANQVAGQLYEFSNGGPLMLAATGSAVGVNATLLVGGIAIINDQPISQANRFPIVPDDVATAMRRSPRGRIVLTLRNTTGGALTANWTIDVG